MPRAIDLSAVSKLANGSATAARAAAKGVIFCPAAEVDAEALADALAEALADALTLAVAEALPVVLVAAAEPGAAKARIIFTGC